MLRTNLLPYLTAIKKQVLAQGQKGVCTQGMREAGLHRRRKEWCAPREMKTKLGQGLEEDTETILFFIDS